ncbi:telomeric repeat-binding factor 2-interacting protein 1 isoform X1 [Scomber scombrus]|uniref:telomeric repeat-binding factor 2-interacting protein 1 isoform X1 n=1 Tax=Scomber scombrus TaxID=13677 RepID=UPI002DD95163|nr:telomeric repeat-binding factor 2-interacting protein 1 isoform X1 [Scomber scombrus]
MPSKQQDAKPKILSVLFMTLDGEPMSFYLRPGPVKSKLQPLITAGGGLLCNVQQPGAILLIDPEEKGSIPESTAHWYVSTQYIHDCIEKDEQLNLEDYRLNPEGEQRQSPRPSNRKEPSPSGLGGRVAYTPEEDDAILSYVSKHKSEIGGNRLWQQMEKQCVTIHSWQSMKYRYRVRLAHKQSEIEEVETTEEKLKAAEEETKEEEKQETEEAAPSQAHSETTDPLQTQSAGTDLTQIDAEPIPAERTQPENSTEAQTSSSPQPEEPPMDPQREAIPAESTEPETDTSQSTPQQENVPEDSQPEPLPSTSSLKKSKQKEKTSPTLVQPQRRSTRRQLELEDTLSSQPYSKKLRSASASIEQPSSSPQPSKKTRPAVKSSSQKDTTVDEPSPKRARGKREATVAECQQEESLQAAVSDTVQADEESDSVPQTGEKKEGRKLGILESATKEFEDESDPEDEAPHHQNPAATVTLQPTSTDPVPPSSDKAVDAASTQSNPEPGPSLQENVQEALASSSNHLPETSCPQPASAEPAASMPTAAQPPATEPAVAEPAVAEPPATEPAVAEPAVAEPAVTEPAVVAPAVHEPAAVAPAGTEPAVPEPPVTEPAVVASAAVVPAAAECAAAQVVPATSKPHLFIFDNESQEEDSQSVIGNNTAVNPQPTVNKEAAVSLTQVQLEEDKQRIRELISQTKQDLICVTKALLRTSGDFSAALELLLNSSSVSGPFWNRCDDSLLLSADPAARQQLQEKYGEEGVAKRIVFLI